MPADGIDDTPAGRTGETPTGDLWSPEAERAPGLARHTSAQDEQGRAGDARDEEALGLGGERRSERHARKHAGKRAGKHAPRRKQPAEGERRSDRAGEHEPLEAEPAGGGERRSKRGGAGRAKRKWYVPGPPSWGGIVGALIFLWFSLTPSLLPLAWLYQGIASGGSLIVGYAIGAFLGWAVRRLVGREISPRVMRTAWLVLAVVGVAAVGGAVHLGHTWQYAVRLLVDEEPLGSGGSAAVVGVALLIAAFFLAIGRLLRHLSRWLGRLLGRWIPRRFGVALAWVVVLILVYFIANRGLIDGFIAVCDHIYSSKNETTPKHVTQPQVPERSGGPGSLVTWDSLGYQGKNFVGRGPTQEELRDFNDADPMEPIRVYAGLDSAGTPKERADLAVRELDRTDAWDRSLLCVATPTGTGWLEPQSVDTLEYMYNGDTAIVAIQYSYLPSWISFLFGSEEPRIAGQTLFEAVYERWSQLPENERPRLIAYGLSLGSYGMQGAFSGEQDMTTRTQGALFSGTPNYTQPWRDFEADRDAGSPQWQPTYENGETIRFAARAEDLTKLDSIWEQPRIIYLQHASDPVVWWSWDLLLHEPDWLREPRGPDVSPSMRWYPFVTWAQVSVNQFVATLVPAGHGHNYGNMMVSAFDELLSPPGWGDDKTAALQAIINELPIE